jgi:hypothetical protein
MAKSRLHSRIDIETDARQDASGRLAEDPVPLPNTWGRVVVRAVRPLVDGGSRPAKASVWDLLTELQVGAEIGKQACRCR